MADGYETLTLVPPEEEAEDEQRISASDPLSSPAVVSRFSSPRELCPDLDHLHELASRGQWRAVLERVARARSLSLLPLPHHHLLYLTLALLALLKLRRFPDAALELQSLSPDSDDASLDSPRFRFDSHPLHYPSRTGSMLPFALRLLHADLPSRLGDRPESLDRLYSLLDHCRSRSASSSSPSSLTRWRRREAIVASVLVRSHFLHKEFDTCLLLLRELLSRDPQDPALLSRLGYVQMQIGDLDGCKATFACVEALDKVRDLEFENLVRRNRALGFVLSKDYLSAVREYDECIERDPGDVAALNNKALCLMYSRDLSDSIKVLEGALERVPQAAVNELLVVNLCSMYELAYVNHLDIKKSLSTWIARVAPDDFDASCTRI